MGCSSNWQWILFLCQYDQLLNIHFHWCSTVASYCPLISGVPCQISIRKLQFTKMSQSIQLWILLSSGSFDICLIVWYLPIIQLCYLLCHHRQNLIRVFLLTVCQWQMKMTMYAGFLPMRTTAADYADLAHRLLLRRSGT